MLIKINYILHHQRSPRFFRIEGWDKLESTQLNPIGHHPQPLTLVRSIFQRREKKKYYFAYVIELLLGKTWRQPLQLFMGLWARRAILLVSSRLINQSMVIEVCEMVLDL